MNRRLNPDQRLAIMTAYLAGEKVITIAMRFGVHHTYPSILARRLGHQLRGRQKPPKEPRRD